MILRSDYMQSTLIINLHGMTVPVFFVFPVEGFNPANSDGLSSVWTLKGHNSKFCHSHSMYDICL